MLEYDNIVTGEYKDKDNNDYLFENNILLITMYYDTGDILNYKYIWENNKLIDKVNNEIFYIEYCDMDRVLLVTNESLYLALFKKN